LEFFNMSITDWKVYERSDVW